MQNQIQKKFFELSDKERFAKGDGTSRRAFKAYCSENNVMFIGLGICERPASSKCYQEPLLTKAPDALCETPDGNVFFTEVKGCGKRGVNIKCENLDYYKKWSWSKPLNLFIYNSSTNKFACLPLQKFQQAVDFTGSTFSQYNTKRNKTEVFYNVPCSSFDWHDMPNNFKNGKADNYTE